MLRNIGGVIAGMVMAFVMIGVLEAVGHLVMPPPENLMSADIEKRQAAFAALTPWHFLLVLIAWAVGVGLGSFVAAAICRGPRILLAGIIGVFIFLGAFANLIMIPSPLWFWIAGLAVIPASCYAGALLACRIWPAAPSGVQPYDMRAKNMAC